MLKWFKILIIGRLYTWQIYILFTIRLLGCTDSQKSTYLCSGIQKSSKNDFGLKTTSSLLKFKGI